MNNKKRLLPFLAALVFLASCAGERAHREGIELMDVGRTEEGLAKLEQASREAPNNMDFRADLIRKREQYITQMLLMADNERSSGRPEAAEMIYNRVLNVDRENARATAGLDAVKMDRRHEEAVTQAKEMLKKNDLDGAEAKLRPVLHENPAHADAKELQRQISNKRASTFLDNPDLQSKFKKPITLQFRDANLKMVFEALSRTSGINILLDRDIRPDHKVTIFVKDVSVNEVIDLILMQSQLEKKVLSDNTVFIYPNTAAKIKDYQDLKIRSFHFDNADAKQMLTMIKTVLKTKDLFLDEKTNSLVMRDTPEAIRLAEKLVATQDIAEPEVLLEVEVLEVSHTRLTELGIKWPSQIGLSVTGSTQTVTPTTVTSGGAVVQGAPTLFTQPLTLASLRHINSASVNVTPLNWAINFLGQDSDANILASPRIRARNKEKAKIMVGDRLPVITNSVTPVASGSPVVTGSVQYLDVGLKLEVEPAIHPDGEVAIKVGLEVSHLVKEVPGTAGSVAYQIGTRNASTLLSLKDGETQILGGLISDEDRKAAQKIPGLGDIPILDHLFGSNRKSRDRTEIILSITPHIIRNTPQLDSSSMEFWSGTDSTLRTRPVSLEQTGVISLPAHGAAPAKPASTPAPLPAQPAKPAQPAQPAKPAAPQSKIPLSFQGPSQAKVGEQFTLSVSAESTEPLASFPLRIGFDPAALKVVDVKTGDFFKPSNVQNVFSKEVNASAGQISLNLSTAGNVGATGSGTLATITFEALAAKPATQVAILTTGPTGPDGTKLPSTLPPPHSIGVASKP